MLDCLEQHMMYCGMLHLVFSGTAYAPHAAAFAAAPDTQQRACCCSTPCPHLRRQPRRRSRPAALPRVLSQTLAALPLQCLMRGRGSSSCCRQSCRQCS